MTERTMQTDMTMPQYLRWLSEKAAFAQKGVFLRKAADRMTELEADKAELLEAVSRTFQYVLLAARDAQDDPRLSHTTKQMPIRDSEMIQQVLAKHRGQS